MALVPGARLGPYEVLAALGKLPHLSPDGPGAPPGHMAARYDTSPDGALLMMTGETLGRDLGGVLNFDEVIRRKLAEASK